MSNYHFGDDYDLNYYPPEASDGMGGVDWDKVERVEIECDVYVKELTCRVVKNSRKYVLSDGTELFDDGCSICNGYIGAGENYCSNCGAKVVSE